MSFVKTEANADSDTSTYTLLIVSAIVPRFRDCSDVQSPTDVNANRNFVNAFAAAIGLSRLMATSFTPIARKEVVLSMVLFDHWFWFYPNQT